MTDPFFIAVAASLVGKAAGSVYELIAAKFRGRPDAEQVLAEVTAGGKPEAVGQLAAGLASVTADDPAFEVELRRVFASAAAHNSDDAVSNQILGDATGKVVQARDVEGGIKF